MNIMTYETKTELAQRLASLGFDDNRIKTLFNNDACFPTLNILRDAIRFCKAHDLKDQGKASMADTMIYYNQIKDWS
jgi:hypothetical protein